MKTFSKKVGVQIPPASLAKTLRTVKKRPKQTQEIENPKKMKSSLKRFPSSTGLLPLLLALLFVGFNVALAQDEPTPQAESSESAAAAPTLPAAPRRFDNSLTSVTLALFWTLGLFVVLVLLVKFSSPLRFRSSSDSFKTVESSFIMRGKVELATISWRDKLILIARSGDMIVKLSEIESTEEETPGANLEK